MALLESASVICSARARASFARLRQCSGSLMKDGLAIYSPRRTGPMGRQLGSPGLPGLGAPVVHSPSAFSFSRLLPGEHHFETTWSKRGRFLRRSRSARHRAAPNCFRSSLDRWGLAVGGRSRGPFLSFIAVCRSLYWPPATPPGTQAPGAPMF